MTIRTSEGIHMKEDTTGTISREVAPEALVEAT